MAVAAACFRAKLAGQPSPAGERTARVLAGYRRTAGDRGRGQAWPFGVSNLAAVLATCCRPRRRGRGVESDQVALERGRVDAVIGLFAGGGEILRQGQARVPAGVDVNVWIVLSIRPNSANACARRVGRSPTCSVRMIPVAGTRPSFSEPTVRNISSHCGVIRSRLTDWRATRLSGP